MASSNLPQNTTELQPPASVVRTLSFIQTLGQRNGTAGEAAQGSIGATARAAAALAERLGGRAGVTRLGMLPDWLVALINRYTSGMGEGDAYSSLGMPDLYLPRRGDASYFRASETDAISSTPTRGGARTPAWRPPSSAWSSAVPQAPQTMLPSVAPPSVVRPATPAATGHPAASDTQPLPARPAQSRPSALEASAGERRERHAAPLAPLGAALAGFLRRFSVQALPLTSIDPAIAPGAFHPAMPMARPNLATGLAASFQANTPATGAASEHLATAVVARTAMPSLDPAQRLPEREPADLDYALSLPAMPIVSWLGAASPQPEPMERESLPFLLRGLPLALPKLPEVLSPFAEAATRLPAFGQDVVRAFASLPLRHASDILTVPPGVTSPTPSASPRQSAPSQASSAEPESEAAEPPAPPRLQAFSAAKAVARRLGFTGSGDTFEAVPRVASEASSAQPSFWSRLMSALPLAALAPTRLTNATSDSATVEGSAASRPRLMPPMVSPSLRPMASLQEMPATESAGRLPQALRLAALSLWARPNPDTEFDGSTEPPRSSSMLSGRFPLTQALSAPVEPSLSPATPFAPLWSRRQTPETVSQAEQSATASREETFPAQRTYPAPLPLQLAERPLRERSRLGAEIAGDTASRRLARTPDRVSSLASRLAAFVATAASPAHLFARLWSGRSASEAVSQEEATRGVYAVGAPEQRLVRFPDAVSLTADTVDSGTGPVAGTPHAAFVRTLQSLPAIENEPAIGELPAQSGLRSHGGQATGVNLLSRLAALVSPQSLSLPPRMMAREADRAAGPERREGRAAGVGTRLSALPPAAQGLGSHPQPLAIARFFAAQPGETPEPSRTTVSSATHTPGMRLGSWHSGEMSPEADDGTAPLATDRLSPLASPSPRLRFTSQDPFASNDAAQTPPRVWGGPESPLRAFLRTLIRPLTQASQIIGKQEQAAPRTAFGIPSRGLQTVLDPSAEPRNLTPARLLPQWAEGQRVTVESEWESAPLAAGPVRRLGLSSHGMDEIAPRVDLISQASDTRPRSDEGRRRLLPAWLSGPQAARRGRFLSADAPATLPGLASTLPLIQGWARGSERTRVQSTSAASMETFAPAEMDRGEIAGDNYRSTFQTQVLAPVREFLLATFGRVMTASPGGLARSLRVSEQAVLPEAFWADETDMVVPTTEGEAVPALRLADSLAQTLRTLLQPAGLRDAGLALAATVLQGNGTEAPTDLDAAASPFPLLGHLRPAGMATLGPALATTPLGGSLFGSTTAPLPAVTRFAPSTPGGYDLSSRPRRTEASVESRSPGRGAVLTLPTAAFPSISEGVSRFLATPEGESIVERIGHEFTQETRLPVMPLPVTVGRASTVEATRATEAETLPLLGRASMATALRPSSLFAHQAPPMALPSAIPARVVGREPLAIQRVESGGSAVAENQAHGGDEPHGGVEGGQPGAAAGEVDSLAKEVWSMLRRRLFLEADRRGRW